MHEMTPYFGVGEGLSVKATGPLQKNYRGEGYYVESWPLTAPAVKSSLWTLT